MSRRRDEPVDAADLSWPRSGEIRPEWVTIYDDRPLTRWERIRMWFTRVDPRVLYSGPMPSPPVLGGQTVRVEWGELE